MSKGIISLLMALCMCLSLLPVKLFSGQETTTIPDAYQQTETVEEHIHTDSAETPTETPLETVNICEECAHSHVAQTYAAEVPDHVEVTHEHRLGDKWIADEHGHRQVCLICGEAVGEVCPHVYVAKYSGGKTFGDASGDTSDSASGNASGNASGDAVYGPHFGDASGNAAFGRETNYEGAFCSVCGYEQPSGEHRHTCNLWDHELIWYEDADGHFQMCDTCGEYIEGSYATHTYENGYCTICGAVDPNHEHRLSSYWGNDSSNYHYRSCAICGERITAERHQWVKKTYSYDEYVRYYDETSGYWRYGFRPVAHTYWQCSICGYTTYRETLPTHDTHGICQSSVAGHWSTCSDCHCQSSDIQPHTYVNGICSVCGYCSPTHTHTYDGSWISIYDGHCRKCTTCGDWDIASYEAHTYVDGKCTVCGAVDPNHEHMYQGCYCTICGQFDPGHAHEFGWWESNALAHRSRCWICTELLSEWESHSYADGKCTVCGAAEPDHQHVMADGYGGHWDNEGHYRYCEICSERMSEIAPHSYNSNGICTVCGAVGSDHIHKYATDHFDSNVGGHWLYCTTCGREVYEPHNYVNGFCGTCGFINPEHTHVAGDHWYSNDEGHYHECQYATCGAQIGDIIPHTYENGRCTVCGHVDPNHICNSSAMEYSDLYHWHACSICGKRMDGGEAHNFSLTKDGRCAVCGYDESYRCGCYYTGRIISSCELGHYYACSHCGGQTSPMEAHTFVDGVCTVCGYVDPNHLCVPEDWMIEENFWYFDDEGHYHFCKLCGKQIDFQEHTYGEDSRCIVCGHVDPNHICVPEDRWQDNDEGHYRACELCYERMTDIIPHTYENGRCTVCGHEDPNHTCAADKWWRSDGYMGHYQVCSLCHERMGEVQHHVYEHGRCTVCGQAAPNHVHEYHAHGFAEAHETYCDICGDYLGQEAHSFDENGVCSVCGYQRDAKEITALSIRNGEHGALILTVTYADDSICDYTVTGTHFRVGDGVFRDGLEWHGKGGEVFTTQGLLPAEDTIWFIYLDDGRFYAAADPFDGNGVESNILDNCGWYTVYQLADDMGIVNPVCTFDDGIWTVTGRLYDGTEVMVTMDEDYQQLSYQVGHVWDQGVITEAADCTTDGSITYTCLLCGTTHAEVIPAGHDYVDTITKPTPTQQGYTTHTCSHCHHSYQDTYTDFGPVLTVSKDRASEGETVTLTVSFDDNPGINTFTLGFEYDTDALELLEVAAGEELPGNLIYGKKAVWLNTQDTDLCGTILTLTFRVRDGAEAGEYPVTVTYRSGDIGNRDEVPVNPAVESGSITVLSYVRGDINGDGQVNNMDLNRLMKYLAEEEVTVQEAALDVNGDGEVDNKDMNRLMKYLAGEDVVIY